VLQSQLGPLQLYKWLQHASTVGGAVIIVIWVRVWVRRTTPTDVTLTRLTRRFRLLSWIATLTVGLAVACAIWLRGMTAGASPLDPSLVFHTTTIGLAAAGLVGFVLSLIWRALPVRSTQAVRSNEAIGSTEP
jgi:hypothetical protein